MNSGIGCAGKYSSFQCKPGGCSIYSSCVNPDKDLRYQEVKKIIWILVDLIVHRLGRAIVGDMEYVYIFNRDVDIERLPVWYQNWHRQAEGRNKRQGGKDK